MSTGILTGPPAPLTADERRVAGVLVEKQKTTPEAYPLTINAIVVGSNQKSNRDPVTNYDADNVEDALDGLRRKGAAVMVEGSGRVVKWRHLLYEWLGLKGRPVELAVLAELLLRGPQTEGDLRARAARMDPIPDLSALQTVLESLTARGLVVTLTPPGQRRGVVVTHGLYPPDELERVRRAQAARAVDDPDDDGPAPVARPAATTGWAAEVAALRDELAALRGRVERLEDALGGPG